MPRRSSAGKKSAIKMKTCYKANVVTKEKVLADSFVTVENGIITYVGNDCPKDCKTEDLTGKYIMAGFIDIHCHASANNMAYEDPKEVGDL